MAAGKIKRRHEDEEVKLLRKLCAFLEKSNKTLIGGTEVENFFD